MANQKYDILSPAGSLIRQHILSANCSRKFSLMNEDSVTLRFWMRDAVKFPVGSSVGDFHITQEQVGKWNESTGVWDYELKFDAYYWLWANKILRYIISDVNGNVLSALETSFTLTATIDVHANVILNCLKHLGIKYDGSPFRVDTNDTSLSREAKLVRYENLSVLGGIQAIAEAFGCEWWVSGNAIYFGRCENSDSKHVFEAGINTSSISFQQAKSEAPNRLYVYGSDRNLPTNYRQVDGNDTIGGVVAKRLMLPEGTPYLQTDPDIPENQIVEKVVVLDSVYPRTDLTVLDDPETYTSTSENEDGNKLSETYYRLKYNSSFLFSESYVLPNEELHVVFQSGLLNGMDFGVKFNPKGLNEKNKDGSWNPNAQMFEVVVNEDYGRRLPDDVLKPQKGDKFILYGWDSTKMADLGLIADAEQELLEEGEKALEEYTKDLSSCTCPMAWDYMKPLFATNTQPKPGDVVTIIDTAHFGKGGRKSRIIGFEYKIDKPYAECTYTCGENISTKRLDSIEKKIEGLTKSGTKVQMQNSLDFLSKRYSDRTPYLLSSDKGFEVGEFVSGVSGAIIGKEAGTGQTFGEMDKLFIRVKAYFESLTVIEANTLAGKQYITPGGAIKCTSVEEIYNGQGIVTAYRCYFLSEQDGEKTETKMIAGDQVISEMFNAKTGTTNKVSNHRWWRLATAVSNDAYTDESGNRYGYIEVSATNCEAGSDIPQEGDVLCQLGWQGEGNSDRKTAMVFSTVDSDAPSIKMYSGIDSYSLNDKAIISFGRDPLTNQVYFRLGNSTAKEYLQYTQQGGLNIAGSITTTSTIGDKTLNQYFTDLIPEVSREDIESYVNAIVDPKIDGIQNQIDGVIETWFSNGVPTLSNYPASEWNDNQKIAHLGDLYYDNDTGTAYRFSQNTQGNYYWNVITDDAITKALAASKEAYDLADGKRRTFVAQPAPPYSMGDIWVNATYGTQYNNDILRCITAKTDGQTFNIADWTLASKYTDDSALNQFISDYNDTIDDIKGQLDGKAETWYQATDPSTAWNTDALKALHVGDLWYNTTNGTTWYWNGTAWKEQNVPDSVFDKIDGKADIFVAKPASYHKNDLWFLESDYTLSDGKHDAGTLVVALHDMGADGWKASDWAKKDRYTDDTLAQSAKDEIAGYQYIKEALTNGATITEGSLILSGLIKLGLFDLTDREHPLQTKVYAGLNGIFKTDKSPILWGGGDMIDRFYKDDGTQRQTPLTSGFATSMIRMDGSAYFGGGAHAFNPDGTGWLGDKDNGIKFAGDGSLILGSGIKINLNTGEQGLKETIESFANILTYFIPEDSTGKTVAWGGDVARIRVTKGFYSDSFISARGANPDGGASGGATQLRMLEDVLIGNNLASGQALVYNGTKWVNQAIQQGLNTTELADYLTTNNYAKKSDIPSLTGYAKEEWVEGKGYLTDYTIHALTLQSGAFSAETYNPKNAAKTVNIPTTTSHITEGTRLYFTDARAQAALASTVMGINTAIGGKVAKAGDAMMGLLTAKTGSSHTGIRLGDTYLTAIGGDVIFQNNNAIRFGTDDWDYDKWAGLKYDAASKTIHLGIADKSIFAANAAQTGGVVNLVNCSLKIGEVTISYDATNKGLKISGGGIYSESYVSARGANSSGGSSSGGGVSYNRLDNWADYATSKDGYVLSAKLGYDLYSNKADKSALSDYATKTWVDAKNFIKDAGDGRNLQFNYSANSLGYDNFTWVAVWNGNTLQCCNKNVFASASSLANYAKLRAGNDLICHTNEFNFVPANYNNKIWFNYRCEEGKGTISGYHFGNGASNAGYAPIVASAIIKNNGTASQILMADGSTQNLYKASEVTTATSDSGTLTPYAMNQWTAKTYLPLTGGTLKNGSAITPLSLSTDSATEIGLRFMLANTARGYTGYHPTYGANLYNYVANKYLGLRDNGEAYVGNNLIWHQGNDGSGSGLDADLLDGLHYTAFARADQVPTVDLNNVNGIGMLCNPLNANATTGRHYPIVEAGCLIYCTAAYSSANQIYGTYLSNRWFARGGAGYDADHPKTSWREFAFLDSNVASATKLANTRTIWGQNFNGEADIPITASGKMPYLYFTALDNSAAGYVGRGSSSNNNIYLVSYDSAVSIGANSGTGDIFVNTSHNVGIGTTNPTQKLEVNGSALISSACVADYFQAHLYYLKLGTVDKGYYFDLNGNGDMTIGRHNKLAGVDTAVAISQEDNTLVAYGNVLCKSFGYFIAGLQVGTKDNNAGLEIYHATPYIDFHFGRSTADYTSRIIEEASGRLAILGTLRVSVGMYSDGYVSARGQNTSDKRLKTNIRNFNASAIIKALRPVSFKWNALARSRFKVFDTDELQYGLIAQEAEKVAPWLVKDGMFGDEYKGVWYERLIPVLAKCQKEQIFRIDNLLVSVKNHEERIAELERENRELKRKIGILERR